MCNTAENSAQNELTTEKNSLVPTGMVQVRVTGPTLNKVPARNQVLPLCPSAHRAPVVSPIGLASAGKLTAQAHHLAQRAIALEQIAEGRQQSGDGTVNQRATAVLAVANNRNQVPFGDDRNTSATPRRSTAAGTSMLTVTVSCDATATDCTRTAACGLRIESATIARMARRSLPTHSRTPSTTSCGV